MYYRAPWGVVGEPSDIMVFLKAYFDESGKVNDHDIASFCGFVATEDEWKIFERRWGNARVYSELRDVFKAPNAIRYRRAFSKNIPAQTAEERVLALTPFTRAIRDSVRFGVAVTIDCRAFKALPREDRAMLKEEPHYLAFRMALLIILQHAEYLFQGDDDIRIALSCDEEERTSFECLRIFIDLRRRFPLFRKRFVSLEFADDTMIEPLQAADFIASIARLESAHKFHGKPFDMRGLYDLLCVTEQDRPIGSKFMGAEVLSGYVNAEREDRKKKKPVARKV